MSLDIFCCTRPAEGQSVCSVHWRSWETNEHIVMAVANGLAPGAAEAAFAAEAALACVASGLERSLEQMFAECDARLRDTGGVALALAIIDKVNRRISLASVGGLRIAFLTSKWDCRMGGTRGIIGAGYEALRPETMTVSAGDVLAIFSKSLGECLTLRQVRKEARRSTREEALTAMNHATCRDEDVGVLIYRHGAGVIEGVSELHHLSQPVANDEYLCYHQWATD
jgi:hypothetical protein